MRAKSRASSRRTGSPSKRNHFHPLDGSHDPVDSMTKPADPIADFWKLFRDRATALAAAESDDDASYDELLERLQDVASGLDLEFRNEPGSSELIIFAEGKRELEPIVEA